MSLRILLLTPQLMNIGNGFIAKGAKANLQLAFPDAEIVESSAFSYFLSDLAVQNGADKSLRRNTVGIGEFVDADLAVLPGCILHPEPLKQHLELFKYLSEISVPLLLLGAGGNDYEPDTVATVQQLLDEGDVNGIIARDESAYDAYKNSVRYAEKGIDCAFFLDDWYLPPTANRNFVTATFDKIEEPIIETNNEIIRPHHAPFDLLRDGYEGAGIVGQILHFGRRFSSSNKLETVYDELERDNLFVSDDVRDYLFFYANATEVHADRIHACLPGLVYGNDVKFYYDTPRDSLFDGLVESDSRGFETLKRNLVDSRKEEQIEMVRDAYALLS